MDKKLMNLIKNCCSNSATNAAEPNGSSVKEKDVISEMVRMMNNMSQKSGKDEHNTFIEFLDYIIWFFDIQRVTKYPPKELMMQQIGEPKFEIMMLWITYQAMISDRDKTTDILGKLYEEMFLSKSRADKLGQFFTPMDVSRLTAKLSIGNNRDMESVYDPACGSGRLLIAAYEYLNKNKFHYYNGVDIDPMSVKLCTCNMMVNGMAGNVTCRNSLHLYDFKFGYEVNEVRWPIPTDFFSIRVVDEKEYISRHQDDYDEWTKILDENRLKSDKIKNKK